jgi:hypothetical protein
MTPSVRGSGPLLSGEEAVRAVIGGAVDGERKVRREGAGEE